MAQHGEVTAYGISTNRSGISARGDKELKYLAEQTGGRAFIPFESSDLAANFQDISHKLLRDLIERLRHLVLRAHANHPAACPTRKFLQSDLSAEPIKRHQPRPRVADRETIDHCVSLLRGVKRGRQARVTQRVKTVGQQ